MQLTLAAAQDVLNSWIPAFAGMTDVSKEV
jgi:hypothetical protein